MPDSSFFEPMQFSGQRQAPTFKAGYNNVYGTRANIGLDPVTKQANVYVRFPVGDHQNQLFLTGGGYATPARPGGNADWGVRVGFEKKIRPQGQQMGQLIDQSLSEAAGVQSAGGFSNDMRARMMESLTDEERQNLVQNIKNTQRQYIDQQLGIVPGATKFGYDLGVDMKSDAPIIGAGMPSNSAPTEQMSGVGIPGNIDPATFAKTYANSLMRN